MGRKNEETVDWLADSNVSFDDAGRLIIRDSEILSKINGAIDHRALDVMPDTAGCGCDGWC